MKRAFILFALPLALAACTPDLSPEAARDAALEAEAAGDARTAVRYYKAAANGGDLDAMRTLAHAYEDGYLRVHSSSHATHLPIFTFPGQGRRWRQRYERERNALTFGGDPEAMLRLANDLEYGRRHTPATKDSARAIRQRLVANEYPPALIEEALNRDHESPATRDSLLARAEALGSGQACLLRLVLAHARENAERQRPPTAAETAAHIDDVEACPALPGKQPYGGEVLVRNLRRADTPEAAATLDSLRALGVFERHPRLAQI